MNTLEQTIHNIRDHVAAILDAVYGGQATGAVRERLLAHIATEEQQNQQHLEAALTQATSESQKHGLRIARDHSQFIVDIIEGKNIAPELAHSLLRHMLEEHDERHFEVAVTTSENLQPDFTVGSLIERKDP